MNPMQDLVSRVQRELPDTDQTRYDVAYQRGRAQTRSTLLLGGLAFGSALGAGLMWLLDPTRGAERRAELAERAADLKNTVARTAGGLTEGRTNGASAPDVPGSDVPDPIMPEEVEAYGPSGPVAGAATASSAEESDRH